MVFAVTLLEIDEIDVHWGGRCALSIPWLRIVVRATGA